MTSLDSIPGIDPVAASSPDVAVMQDATRRRNAEQAQAQAQQAQYAAAAREQDRKVQAETASGDALFWATNPSTKGKSFGDLDAFSQAGWFDRYPAIKDQIPGLYNDGQTAVTGRPVGVKLQGDETATSKIGNTTITGMTAPQTDEDGQPVAGGSLGGNAENMAQMIANYELSPNLSRMPPAQKMRIMGRAKQINRDFDQQEYDSRLQARKSYEPGGKNGQAILAGNTVIDHGGQVFDLIDNLNNTRSSWANRPLNAISEGLLGNSSIGQFRTAANIFSTELAKALAGGNQPAQAEIEHYNEMLNPNLGPDQLRRNTLQMLAMFGSKAREMQNDWNSSVKSPRDVPFLNEGARSTLSRLGMNPDLMDRVTGQPAPAMQSAQPQQTAPAQARGAQPVPAAASGQAPATPAGQPAPQQVTTKAQYDAMPPGAKGIDSTGQVFTKKAPQLHGFQ